MIRSQHSIQILAWWRSSRNLGHKTQSRGLFHICKMQGKLLSASQVCRDDEKMPANHSPGLCPPGSGVLDTDCQDLVREVAMITGASTVILRSGEGGPTHGLVVKSVGSHMAYGVVGVSDLAA